MYVYLVSKEFVVFLTKKKGTSRIHSLLSLMGLEGRICRDRTGLEIFTREQQLIEYETIEKILELERRKAWLFLRCSLCGEELQNLVQGQQNPSNGR